MAQPDLDQTQYAQDVIDPELQGGEQATQAAQQALREAEDTPEPEIEEMPDGSVELCVGLLDVNGQRLTDAEVVEMTGEVEEVLARPAVRRNYGKFVTELLVHCTERIGREAPSREAISSLVSGDRDLLATRIRQVTYGNTFDMQVTCPTCRHDFDVEYDLDSDLPVRRPENPEATFTVELRRGRKAVMRLPNGFDHEELGDDRSNRTIPEKNHILLGRCVETLDDQPVVGTANIKALGLQDIRTLLETMDEKSPGPRFDEVTQQCPNCNNEFPLVVSLPELFRG